MELKGKCKADFREWFLINNGFIDLSDGYLEDWIEFPDSMKWGVLVDFFDSKNILVEIQLKTEPVMEGVSFRSYRPEIIYKNKYHNVGASFGKRNIAQKVVIEKANELYNTKL